MFLPFQAETQSVNHECYRFCYVVLCFSYVALTALSSFSTSSFPLFLGAVELFSVVDGVGCLFLEGFVLFVGALAACFTGGVASFVRGAADSVGAVGSAVGSIEAVVCFAGDRVAASVARDALAGGFDFGF